MDIALWGYKLLGKRTAESMLKYWGNKYRVTRIYDPSRAGEHDPCWDITVADPSSVEEDYKNGLFQQIMLCVMTREPRIQLEADFAEAGIPVFVPGAPEDFLSPDEFGTETAGEVCGCRIYRCRDALAAAADFYSDECMYVFNRKGRILAEQWLPNDNYDPGLPLLYPFRMEDPLPEKIRMRGAYCFLTKEYCSNYWHFTFQCLSEAYLLERAGFTGKYVINDRPYNREIMHLLGISPERIMTTESFSVHKVYALDEIYGAESGYKGTKTNTRVMAGLSSMIRSNLRTDHAYPKQIYIQRTGTRKLVNGEDIARKAGFATIVPEEHSVREQLEYFYNADIVLCPHGANSTNCLYMRRGSVFIELFSDRWYNDINSDICRENGIHHLKAAGTPVLDGQGGMYDDFSIPEDLAASLIEKARMLLEADEKESGTADGHCL